MSGQMHPALRPSNIHAQIKLKYQRQPILRQLFRDEYESTDNYTDVLSMDFLGDIGELSGDAGWKEIKTKFEDVSNRITPFGAFFKVNRIDEKFSKTSVVSANMRDLVLAMKRYYERKVLNALFNISGHNTYAGSQWSDVANGKPLIDFEGAIGESEGASGVTPDLAIMNRATFLVLLAYPQYSQFQYLGTQNIIRPGIIDKITPNGLKLLVLPDAIASTYIPDNKIYVTASKMCGANHLITGFPFDTEDMKDPYNPLITRYYGYEFAKPVIDKHDAPVTTVITVT